MKLLVPFVASVLLLIGCRQPDNDAAFQEHMKTWSAEQERRIATLSEAIEQLKPAPVSPKFTITTINGEHYKRIFKVEESSGESWLFMDAADNHGPSWLRLGYVKYAGPIVEKSPTTGDTRLPQGIPARLLDHDPVLKAAGLLK